MIARGWVRYVLGLALLLLPALSWAQLTYSTLVDVDNNATTGCTVTLPTAGTVSGIERRITATVTQTAPPTVTALTLEVCSNGSFGAPSALPGTPYPVGLNDGLNGADVIEQAVPADAVGPAGITVRLYFAAQGPLSDDLIATDDGSAQGAPILFVLAAAPGTESAPIPTLNHWSLMGLTLLLAGLAGWRLRRYGYYLSLVALVILSGIVLADLDGQVGDWAGKNPIATDPQGDSANPSTDLTTVFAYVANGILNLRLDVADAQPVNHAPTFTKGTDQTVLEDAGAQTVPGWATAIDDGDPDVVQTLTFQVTGNTNTALFSAGPAISSTGVLTYTPAPNANGSATLTVVLKDDGGTANGGVDTSTPQTFVITVTAVNDAPSFTKGADQTVSGTAGAQTVPGWATSLSAGPADEAGQTLNFTLTNNTNPSLFSAGPAISPAGVLTYTPVNSSGSATLTVTLHDNGGTANGGVDTSAPQTFTITVTAVDIPPTAVNDSATVTEDDPATAIAVLTNDTDPDGGPKSIASVTQPANGTVIITGAGSGLTYQPTADYCNSPPGTTLDTFTYTLTPGSSTATVSVTVTCVNDAPVVDLNGPSVTGVDFAATFTEGNPPVAVGDATNLTVTDVDNANLASVTVTLTNLLDAGQETLAVDATTISPNTAIVAAYDTVTTPGQGVLTLTGSATLAEYQAALRTLTYTNGSPNPTTTPRVIQVVANDGTADSAVATSTVTVDSINSAPSFTKGADQTVLEDAGAQTVNGWATSIDDGDGNLGGQVLTFQITANTNTALFSAGPAISSTGVLTYTPAANANGSATITVELKDDGGTANGGVDTSTAQTFVITVTAVNDAPSFTKGADQTVLEDAGAQTVAGWATSISAGPTDESGQTLTFNITGNTNPGLFSAAPAISSTGTLTYTPAANAFGSATITVTLQDSGGTANGGVDTSAAQTFVINVTAVNDAPSFTKGADQTVLEDAGAQTVAGWATGISAGPNEAAQTLTFNITGNTNPGLFSAGPAVASNGTLTYTPAPNQNGSATITLALMDNGGTANGGVDTSGSQSFTITVNAVNDPPVAQNKTGLSAQANMTVAGIDAGLLTGVTDADSGINGCNPTFSVASITANTGGTVSGVNLAAGTFDFNPAPGFTGTAIVNYTVQDDGCPGPAATSAAATISITVNGPVIWFVNGSAATGGDGTLAKPFQTIAQADAVDAANQAIFVAFNGTSYANGIALNTGEWLIGQGVSGASFDNVFGITPPTGTIARPAIGGSRPTLQNTVTMGTSSQVKGLNIASTTNTGITASGQTGLVTSEVSVTTTTGTAASFSNSGGTLSFTSISANGGANGIVLNTTTGSFTVTGDGGGSNNGSGGTIQNTAAEGILLSTAANVSLGYMNINNSGTDSIRITNINGFTFNRSNISDSAGSTSDKAIDIGDFVTGTSVNGNINITNSVIGPASGNSPHDSLAAGISSGTSTWSITGTTFRNTGNSGINMELRGSSTLSANVNSSTFAGAGGAISARGIFVNNLDDSVITDFTIQNNSFTNNNIHIDMNQQNDTDPVGSHTFSILNNTTMTGANSHAINIFTAAGSFGGSFTGTISGNAIGNSAVSSSGSAIGNGLRVNINGGSDATMLIDGNTIRQTPNGRGIEIIGRNGTGGLDVTVTNNDVNPQAPSAPLAAIIVQSNCLTICNTVRADVRGNVVPTATDVTDLLTTYIELVESSTSTLELVDTTSPISGTCASELAATNTGSTGVLGGCALITGPIATP